MIRLVTGTYNYHSLAQGKITLAGSKSLTLGWKYKATTVQTQTAISLSFGDTEGTLFALFDDKINYFIHMFSVAVDTQLTLSKSI